MSRDGSLTVVAGGTRGVGKAIAEALVESGAGVAVVARTAPRYNADVSDWQRRWADIKSQVEQLGDIADAYRQWVTWVEETGGDPVEKAAQLVLDIIESDVNGQFLWIDEPLQPAIPSWGEAGQEPLWRR